MNKKSIIVIIGIFGFLVLVFSVLVQTGVINLIKENDINPFFIKNEVRKEDVVWNFTETKETDGLTAPANSIELQIKNKKWLIGTYEGNCTEKTDILLVNQISGVTCSWRGFGAEIGLFVENKKLVIKKKIFEINSQKDPYPIFIEEFKTIQELTL